MSNTAKKLTGKLAGALGAGGGKKGGAKGGNGGGDKGGGGRRGQPPKPGTGKQPPRRCDNPECPLMWHEGFKEWEQKMTCPTCKGVGQVTHTWCKKCFTNRKTIESDGKEDCTYCNKERKREVIDPGDCILCEGGTKELKVPRYCPGSGRTR